VAFLRILFPFPLFPLFCDLWKWMESSMEIMEISNGNNGNNGNPLEIDGN
jgi:hypothetical protein